MNPIPVVHWPRIHDKASRARLPWDCSQSRRRSAHMLVFSSFQGPVEVRWVYVR